MLLAQLLQDWSLLRELLQCKSGGADLADIGRARADVDLRREGEAPPVHGCTMQGNTTLVVHDSWI